MPVHDDLGMRMKDYYEKIPQTKLMRRTPVAIRIDGKAFHTFTAGFDKPYDKLLTKTMQETMRYLCENIQGCVFGYCQSDEITLILCDYQTFDTAAWFDYEVQKLCSITASMATMAFNKFFAHEVEEFQCWISQGKPTEKDKSLNKIYHNAMIKGAMFDARCFNIPREEVTNLVYWRQLDAIRNSIQMLGQANFSHRELQGKTCNMIKEMLLEKGLNWDELPEENRHGSSCIKLMIEDGSPLVGKSIKSRGLEGALQHYRPVWVVDKMMPILRGENRQYLDSLVYIGEGYDEPKFVLS